MNSKMIECPKCGNVQPRESEKCYKCNFRLNSKNDYTKSGDTDISKSYGNAKNTNIDKREDPTSHKKRLRIISIVVLAGIALAILAILIIIMVLSNNSNGKGPADGIEVVYKILNEKFTEEDLKKTIENIKDRADILDIDIGIKENMVGRSITVTVPKDVDDFDYITERLSQPGEIYYIYCKGPSGKDNISYTAGGDAYLIRPIKDIIANGDVVIKKEDIAVASPKVYEDQYSGKIFVVHLQLNEAGIKRLAEATRYSYSYYGSDSLENKIAVVIDGKVISTPTVSCVIDYGEAQIQGLRDMIDSRIIAYYIGYEQMPLKLEIVNK